MAKKEYSKSRAIPVQKGPVSMDEQYTQKFCREPQRTMRDMEDVRMRREGQTLTLHTPTI